MGVLRNCQSHLRFLSSSVRKANLRTMKLEWSKMERVLTPELRTLSGIFSKHGYELRIAGGAVRDLLMDKTPSDVDFATTATPDQMKRMFDTDNIEVTTLRVDKVTDGRRAEAEFTKDWQL